MRTYLVLLELTEIYGNPLVASIAEIKQYCNVCIEKSPPSQQKIRAISHRSISKALDELKELGLLTVERKGNVSVINVAGHESKRVYRYDPSIQAGEH